MYGNPISVAKGFNIYVLNPKSWTSKLVCGAVVVLLSEVRSFLSYELSSYWSIERISRIYLVVKTCD